MTFTPPNLIKLLAPLAVFGALLAVLTLVNRPGDELSVTGSSLGDVSGRSGAETTRGLQAAIAANPADASAYAALGDDFLQQARETGDPGYYARADRAYAAALRRDPRDLGAVIGAGTLANLRHDFRAGLRLGQRAHALEPGLARPYVVLADAQIELGRYDAALDSIQRLVERQARLGRIRARLVLPRALRRSRRAPSRPCASPCPRAVRPRAWPTCRCCSATWSSPAATSGQAATPTARRWPPCRTTRRDWLDSHEWRWRAVTPTGPPLACAARPTACRSPRTSPCSPTSSSRPVTARPPRRSSRSCAPSSACWPRPAPCRTPSACCSRPTTGSPARAVALGRDVWRQAPSVRSADALGWALTRSGRPAAGLRWAQRALRLGSRDPLFRFHAGIAARQAGRSRQAARDLRSAELGRALLSPADARRLEGVLR